MFAKRKAISNVLVFLLIISTFTYFGEVDIFASNTKFSFVWQENKRISDVIDIAGRNLTDNELVLNWSYGKLVGGNDDYRGDYLFEYNLNNNERIELKVKTASDTFAEFEYRVKSINGSTVTDKKAQLSAYDANMRELYFIYDSSIKRWYAENNKNDLWQNGVSNTGPQVTDDIFAPAGIQVAMQDDNNGTGVNISIEKGKTVAFKYDGKLVVLNWDAKGETITLGIDNIERSKIYNFKISANRNNVVYSDYLNIYKLVEFDTQPIGEPVINKIISPNSQAGENPTIEVSIAQPSIWDNTVSQFVYNKSYQDIGFNGLKAVVDLETSVSGANKESIQINVPNIYDATTLPNISGTSITNGKIDPTFGVQLKNVGGKIYYTFRLINLESSRLYTIANITMEAIPTNTTDENKLHTKICSLAYGDNAYTYLEFNTETKSTGERILKIKPYNVSGTYYVYKASANLPNMKTEGNRLSRIDYKVSAGTEYLEIPIPNDLNYYYLIEFVHELGTLDSQKLVDNPDQAAYLITPKLEVKNYKIITDTTTDTKKLRLVLSWSGGTKSTFDSLLANGNSVTYSFAKTPFSPREGQYADFFEIDIAKNGNNYSFTKNTTKNPWETGVILNEGLGFKTGHADKINTLSDGKTEVIEVVFTTVLEFDLFDEENLELRDEPSLVFYYPSVYYLKMKGSYINSVGDLKETAYCNPVNVTLDANTNIVLPPPQNIAVNNITSKSFKINWSTLTEKLFGEYLESNNYTLKDKNSALVNIFVTQKNVMTETDSEKQLAYFKNEDVVAIDFQQVVDRSIIDEVTIDLSSMIDYLRDNKMVKITNAPQNLDLNTQVVNIIGLDRNTVYYTALQTALNVVNIADGSEEQVVSDAVSQILNVTTKAEDDLISPKPEEIPPISPKDFKEDTAAEKAPTRINLTWTDVKEPENINGIEVTKEYELIRLDKKLDENLYNERTPFNDFWRTRLGDLSASAKVAWQTASSKASNENLLIYNGSNFVLDTSKTNGKHQYKTDKHPKLDFVDDSVMPNRIYYYYLRTVRMAKDSSGNFKEVAWSSWEPVAVTTVPIVKPENLKVERDETYFTYDKNTEMVISFFAAIPKGTTFSEIAQLYPLEYSIMEDGGEWKTYTMDVTNTSRFKNGTEQKTGYQQYVYKITGLKPGTGYTVKVRMKARVNSLNESPAIFDTSLDSNTVYHRTNLDQGEYDQEQDMKKWLDLFDKEVLLLATKPYWTIVNTTSDYEVIYRTKTFGGELQKAVSKAYEFESTDQTKQTYYLPASALTNSDELGIGFKVVRNDMEVLIRPDSFDKNPSEAISSVLSKIKQGDVKDYYIKVEVTFNKSTQTINNASPLTEQIQVKISAVGSKEMEKTVDANFVDLYNKAINGNTVETAIREKLKIDLRAALKKNATNEELYQLVMKAVKDVDTKLTKQIGNDFDYNTKNNFVINSLPQKLLITANVNSTNNVSGYRKNNTTWEIQNTFNYGNKKGFETSLLGIFVFAGRTVNLPDISGIPNSNDIKDLIAKYGLDDYLGKDIIDSNAYTTKYMIVGSIARILGATNTQDEIAFLNSKGINVNRNKLYNNISNQEALYLVMALYEKKTNTNLSSIKITNYSIMPNMSNVNEEYKKSLQAAIQLGIWTDTSISVNDNIKIKTFLEYLSNLNKKVKL